MHPKTAYKNRIYWERIMSGKCYRCGSDCLINPKTKLHYSECPKHRTYSNKQKSLYKKALRAAIKAGLVKKPDWLDKKNAGMAKLANATDLKSVDARAS